MPATKRSFAKPSSSPLPPSQAPSPVFWHSALHTWMALEILLDGAGSVSVPLGIAFETQTDFLHSQLVILEGILTVIVAVVAYFTLFDFPETASFLTEEERAFVVYRLKYQNFKEEVDGGVRVAQDDSFQWKFVKSAFLDWQIWLNVLVYWGMSSPPSHLSIGQANRARDRMPAIRHIALPALDHSRTRI